MLDQTVAADMEVSMGPGEPDGRRCAYGVCARLMHPDDPPNKRYHHPKCRTADWKARRASQTVPGVVAVRSYVGDAENGLELAGRTLQLREARASGRVANDKRVQYSRAVEEVARFLRGLNVGDAEGQAGRILDRALPKGWRS